ncbi:PLP-dependent transferase [Panus rudis PR-1116 ss-1]|nr:PLP-dependent transferase [Panus rudis PR-1116 ss-1]
MSVKALPKEFYDAFLSDAAKARRPSPIRGLFPLEQTPGVISLLAGKPNSSTFPLTSLELTSRSPTEPGKESTLRIEGAELAEGLQYGPTPGIPSLIEWATGLQEHVHKRKKGEGWRLSIGSGSQHVIYKAAHALLDKGDTMLVEAPVYAGVIPLFAELGVDMIEVETDAYGIKSSSLREILENWPAEKPKPKVLYTVPYGCNPTGMTATTDRRKEVLQLAHEHNFLILEDDPYFYLYYGPAERPPSYFELELQAPEVGRVVRFDSLSKILSSGIRIGWVSGPAPIVNAMDLHTATSILQTPSLTQTIAHAILNSWGYDGFLQHTKTVSEFYRQKRDVFEAAMQKHLGGLAEWTPPESGMFYWFKLKLPDGDSQALIATKAFENGVLALPGTVFLPNGRKSAFVRASFSLLEEDQVNEALKRLRTTLEKELANGNAGN